MQEEQVPDAAVEPLSGIGPLTAPLKAFAEFFDVDADLLDAAAETGLGGAMLSENELRDAIAAIPEREKTELLVRLVDGDAHVAAQLRRRMRKNSAEPSGPRRTAGALRVRSKEIAAARERAEAARREAERRRQAEEAEKARRARFATLLKRGESVWRDIEAEIERRIPASYEKATGLLLDLRALAAEQGAQQSFNHRLASIWARHEKKRKFIDRLARLGLRSDLINAS